MERITTEEAKKYIACSEDFSSHGIEKAQYFTLTPTNDGWEDVTYYTARSSAMYVLIEMVTLILGFILCRILPCQVITK
jgi:hypothetical protein